MSAIMRRLVCVSQEPALRLYVYFFDLWMPKTDELILFNPIQITMQVLLRGILLIKVKNL